MSGVANSKVFTAIDIGTTKVFTIIGTKGEDSPVEVLGHGVAPCTGVHKGVIEDISAVQTAVRSSVSMAQRASGVHVDSAFVGIGGTDISYERRFDTIDWVGKHGVITHKEVEDVPASVIGKRAPTVRHGRKVIHAIPQSYSIDGEIGLSYPIGMHTRKVDVETHLVQGSETEIDRLTQAVEGAGIKIEGLVLEALASSESVLMQAEKVRGAALVDIGGGTTDVVVYKNGTMQYSSVIPIGGYQFTNDICVVYNTTYEAAEEVKVTQSDVLPNSSAIHELISLPISSGYTSTTASLHDICQLTRERAQELTRMIALKLAEGGVQDLNQYPVVLTGGASKLRGFMDLLASNTSAKVRLGVPLSYFGAPRELQKPRYSTGIGILVWATHQYDDEPKPHPIENCDDRGFTRRNFNSSLWENISAVGRRYTRSSSNSNTETKKPRKSRFMSILSR